MRSQQPISGCAFCETVTGTMFGTAYTWGKDERVSHPICPDCAIQSRPDPERHDRHACDGCGVVVDCLPALTSFRMEIGHLEGTIRLCTGCAPSGAATYWTRDLEEHLVATPEE